MKYSNARSVSRFAAGLGVFAMAAALPLMAANPVASSAGAPAYNAAAEVHFSAVITGVRQVPVGSPLAGVHLTVQSKTGSADVYLGPPDFLKIFKTNFLVGAGVQVIGSRVKMGDSETILAREVTEGPITLTLRDDSGAPVWEHWGVPADRTVVTGG